ncbi:pyridoxamine 5'-phosphate oxidase family protein [Streptomyces sp. NPDC005438]|uniref:helix-turn-helix domain-containing protein n=1 Tax=Streptomyces sp. NPDC005438 TaxID=3156880 RepID=UPI0033AAD0B4
MSNGSGRHPMSDIGRRAAARREGLGLSREEVAGRTGAATSYIAYLEEQPAVPSGGFLVRLAHALDTSVQDLTGYRADLPVGGAGAGRDARLSPLDVEECWRLLDDHGVGRVAVTTADGPAIWPVNYRVHQGRLVFMTAADSALAAASGTEIPFEVDRLDEAFSQGWSVLVVGPVNTVNTVGGEEVAGELSEAGRFGPWAGEGRGTVMTLRPRRVTGRRITVRGAPGGEARA